MSWLTGWTNRKSHLITGATGAGNDYQVKIIVNYGSGSDSGNSVYCSSNCGQVFGDIRFTGSDGTTSLPYWMEKKTDATSAVFWVKVLADLSSNQTIYVYYNKPSETTTSNGTDTFDAFRNLVDNFYAALGTVNLTTYNNGQDSWRLLYRFTNCKFSEH